MAGALVDLGWDGTAFKSDFLLMVSLLCETFWLHDYGVGLFRVFFDFSFFLQGTGFVWMNWYGIWIWFVTSIWYVTMTEWEILHHSVACAGRKERRLSVLHWLVLVVFVYVILAIVYSTWERVLNTLMDLRTSVEYHGVASEQGWENVWGMGSKEGTQDTTAWRWTYRCVFYGHGRQR